MRPTSKFSNDMMEMSPPARAIIAEAELDFIDDITEENECVSRSTANQNTVSSNMAFGKHNQRAISNGNVLSGKHFSSESDSCFKAEVHKSRENGISQLDSSMRDGYGLMSKQLSNKSPTTHGDAITSKKDNAFTSSNSNCAKSFQQNKNPTGKKNPSELSEKSSSATSSMAARSSLKTKTEEKVKNNDDKTHPVSDNITKHSERHLVSSKNHPMSSTEQETSFVASEISTQPSAPSANKSSASPSERWTSGTESLSVPSDSVFLANDQPIDRSPSFSLSVGSASSVSLAELQPHKLSVQGPDSTKPYKQRSVSDTNMPTEHDLRMAAAQPRSASTDREEEVTSSSKDGDKEDKDSLHMRISKSLGNFFNRLPNSAVSLIDAENSENQGQKSSKRATQKSQRSKDSKRRVSLAGKLMSSIAEWGRKGSSQQKGQPQEKNSIEATEQDDETFNNNKTPLFVSFEDQAEVMDDVPSKLSESQKLLLRRSWAVIKSDVADVGVETFMGLFHTHPESIESFLAFKDKSVQDIEQSAVLKAHALRVMQTVDKCVSRLDEVDKMANVLSQLGQRHVGYQANVKLIPMIGKQFVAAIEPKMGTNWSSDIKDSWEALFSIINYNLRKGIMLEKHRRMDQANSKRR